MGRERLHLATLRRYSTRDVQPHHLARLSVPITYWRAYHRHECCFDIRGSKAQLTATAVRDLHPLHFRHTLALPVTGFIQPIRRMGDRIVKTRSYAPVETSLYREQITENNRFTQERHQSRSHTPRVMTKGANDFNLYSSLATSLKITSHNSECSFARSDSSWINMSPHEIQNRSVNNCFIIRARGWQKKKRMV